MTSQEIARITAELTELEILALTAWAEARGDTGQGESSVEERIAVMVVVRNRLARRPDSTYRALCLAPKQFSCWNAGFDRNHVVLMELAERVAEGSSGGALYDETVWLAQGVIDNIALDRTRGATHYYAPLAMIPVGRVPSWAIGKPYLRIGKQRFLKV